MDGDFDNDEFELDEFDDVEDSLEDLEDVDATPKGPLEPGLVAGKVLHEPLRHPTHHYILIPRRTILSEDAIEAIRLMGVERQAIAAIGEVPHDGAVYEGDILKEGPIRVRKIETETTIVRNARDGILLVVVLGSLFAFAMQAWIMIGLVVVLLVAWAFLLRVTQTSSSRIESVMREMEEARLKRQVGQTKLQKVIARGLPKGDLNSFRGEAPVERGERLTKVPGSVSMDLRPAAG